MNCRSVYMNLKRKCYHLLRQSSLNFFAGTTLFLGFHVAFGQDDQGEDDNIFLMSPFVIETGEDIGYQANSTLAGTRLNTELRDVGASITVVTEEFMEDTAATNLDELFIYTGNTESAGVFGNFSSTTLQQGFGFLGAPSSSGASNVLNFTGQTRVRGLAAADVTRNFYLTEIPFDDYNTERLDIVRGANSLLFGLGSPAGIVNNTTLTALFSNRNEVSVRFDDHGSFRVTLDVDKEIVEDKLGIRVAGLWEDEKFQQEPAFEEDQRLYLTATYKISKNLTLRANTEFGSIDANRPNPVAPLDNFSQWYRIGASQGGLGTMPVPNWTGNFPPDFPRPAGTLPRYSVTYTLPIPGAQPVTDDLVRAVNFPSPRHNRQVVNFTDNNGQVAPGLNNRGAMIGTFVANNIDRNEANIFRSTIRWTSTLNERRYRPASVATQERFYSLSDFSLFDWENNLLSGDAARQFADFHTYNATLEYLNDDGNFGVEVGIDFQNWETENVNGQLHQSIYHAIQVDPNVSYPIALDDGTWISNPNILRPVYLTPGSERSTREIERFAIRATAFYTFDFEEMLDSKWGSILGDHTITAFANKQERDEVQNGFRQHYFGGDVDRFLANGAQNSTSRRPDGDANRSASRAIYLGPAASTLDQVSISRLSVNPRYSQGEQVNAVLWDKDVQRFRDRTLTVSEVATSGSLSEDIVDSYAVSLNSSFFDGHIVTLFGWRRDEFEFSNASAPVDDEQIRLINQMVLPDSAQLEGSGETRTYSVVGHLPDSIQLPFNSGLSVHYNKSSNFNPVGLREDAFGRTISAPEGTTEDYGFTVSLFDDKFNMRVNWYESNFTNQTLPDATGLLSSAIGIDFFDASVYWQSDRNGNFAPGTNVSDSWGTPPQEVIDQFNAIPPTLDTNWDTTVPTTLADTTDTTAEGVEIDLIYNPLPNWRVLLNIARQETVISNNAPGVAEYLSIRRPVWEANRALPNGPSLLQFTPGITNTTNIADPVTGFYDLETFALGVDDPSNPYFDNTVDQRYTTSIYIPFQALQDQNGAVVEEQREWRANLITNYTFVEGRFSGFGIGGALRYQDEGAIGFPLKEDEVTGVVFDTQNPYFDDSQINGDLWLSYSRMIMDDKVDWRIQVNFRNIYHSGDDVIPISAQPDGSIAHYRLAPQKSIIIRNTFTF